MEREVLELFKAVVVKDNDRATTPNTEMVSHGLVLDFVPTQSQRRLLRDFYKPLPVNTMFTRQERDHSDPFQLIHKQLLHYVEVYGLGSPGLFDLTVVTGKIVTMTYVRGVTVDELGDMVRELLYRNAPVKDAGIVANIISHYGVNFDINQVANNELRVQLFDIAQHKFADGDDAVRYICWVATGSTMLIKSQEVIDAVHAVRGQVASRFIERHERELAAVFNRHKRIILALKTAGVSRIAKKVKGVSALSDLNAAVNRVSRLSKRLHVPLRESVSKKWVTLALANAVDAGVIDKISARDKFKYLNLLAYKRQRQTTDAFVVRNGKIHLESGRRVWKVCDIDRVERQVLASLERDFSHLRGQRVLLDGRVRYGLPVSRKQAVGQLPFGTRVKTSGQRISSGVYWENAWGATDLDLSTVDTYGQRTGWGQRSGYSRSNPITYSGDVTYARSGAMEFMTSADPTYGLFVNIFAGQTGCGMEVVVGEDSDGSKWISDPIIREKTELGSRGMVVGFVRGTEFTVWQGRIGNGRVSGDVTAPYVARGMSEFWTVNDLFEHIGVDFDTQKTDGVDYDHDLSYAGFSYDKLERLLL